MKFVALRRGGGGGGATTVTVKLHESTRSCASATWHRTGVAPRAKLDPIGGLHLKENGNAPPEIVGSGYETSTEE
jgi:hypothetical protein